MIIDSSLAEKIFEICKFVYQGKPGIYLEAGANDGISYSNTLRLERELGWIGTLVEPGIPAYELLQSNRPGNLNLNVALTESESQISLSGTFSSGSLLSSAHPELRYRDIAKLTHKLRGVAKLRAFLKLKPKITLIDIEAQTLDRVIDQSGHPRINLLSLDVEGYELNALLGLKSHKPEIIVVETRSHNVWEINTLLLSRGYVLLGDLSSGITGMEIIEHADLVWVDSKKSKLLNLALKVLEPSRRGN